MVVNNPFPKTVLLFSKVLYYMTERDITLFYSTEKELPQSIGQLFFMLLFI